MFTLSGSGYKNQMAHRLQGLVWLIMQWFSPQDGSRNVMVLIIEDEKVSRRALARLLTARGFAAQAVESAEEALSLIDNGQMLNIALVDLDLPGMNGADFIGQLRRARPGVPALLITAADEDRVGPLSRSRNIPYLRKPIDFRKLLDVLGKLSGDTLYHN
jgi:two-component system response regulator FlrC